MCGYCEQDFLAHQIVHLDGFAVKDRQVEVLFLQLVLLFRAPAYRRDKSFLELGTNLHVDWLQTTIARGLDFGAQLSAQLDFPSVAPNPAGNLSRLHQSDLVVIQCQLARFVRPRKVIALFFQPIKLDAHS